MIPTPQSETPQNCESAPVHPLARFVTPEAIALLLNIKVDQIKDIRCWPNVILVVAKTLTRFVSYADLPPIVEVEAPTTKDFLRWRKRWNKGETKQAPEFWREFYKQKFSQAVSVAELHAWEELMRTIKFALPQKWMQSLRNDYLQAKYKLQPF